MLTVVYFFDKITSWGRIMEENKLLDLSMELSVKIMELVKLLKDKKENIISNQIGRSGTSVSANISEAQYAHSKADFVSKLQIALKECYETERWLETLFKSQLIDENYYKTIQILCGKIRILLITSCKTVKSNM